MIMYDSILRVYTVVASNFMGTIIRNAAAICKRQNMEAEVKTVMKCLGVLLDDEQKWYQHCDEIVKKCTKGLGLLSRLSSTLPFSLKKKVYNAVVLPHLNYCSTVWQECSNKLQTKILINDYRY